VPFLYIAKIILSLVLYFRLIENNEKIKIKEKEEMGKRENKMNIRKVGK